MTAVVLTTPDSCRGAAHGRHHGDERVAGALQQLISRPHTFRSKGTGPFSHRRWLVWGALCSTTLSGTTSTASGFLSDSLSACSVRASNILSLSQLSPA